MRRQTPRSTRTYPLFPYTTLYRALRMMDVAARDHGAAAWDVTVFDTTPLREAFGGFDAGATQLLQEFVADAVDRIAEIARHDGDAAALRPLAHALKGGARSVGAGRLGDIASDLQDRAEERRVGEEGVRTCRSRGSPYN